jgi:hypothetical protein
MYIYMCKSVVVCCAGERECVLCGCDKVKGGREARRKKAVDVSWMGRWAMAPEKQLIEEVQMGDVEGKKWPGDDTLWRGRGNGLK